MERKVAIVTGSATGVGAATVYSCHLLISSTPKIIQPRRNGYISRSKQPTKIKLGKKKKANLNRQ